MRWTNVVLRVAAMLLPYQRPTYRSIEVRTDHIDGDRRRLFDNLREELRTGVTTMDKLHFDRTDYSDV